MDAKADFGLKVGDVVILRSGGPKMTIEWIEDRERVASVVWFKENEAQSKHFALAVLKKVV